ncbi:unnamed protein product [Rotaria socialis]|nr:unnamed protein product [Rotaria socialis]CAF3308388.1 unnamed protein product [Rotaria socialis]CAF3421573.1 unnamed protein product [Rotaria socialis]CAF3703078.1 unnamed protein product [Rotaria socialis]
MINQSITDDEDANDHGNEVLDLSIKKSLLVLLSPPSSTTSSSSSSSYSASSVISSQQTILTGKRMLDLHTSISSSPITTKGQQTNKRPLRFQCKHCDYKAPSTSLMQNHIYRHTDLTPYACAYCGHKSTTKSTIMVHIELCHPNMEVKIIENRVREQDFYRDLNSSDMSALSNKMQEPQIKKQRHSNQYDSESAPINGVAISLKTIIDDGNQLSPASDEIYGADNFESMLLPTSDILDDDNEQLTRSSICESSPTLKFKLSPSSTPTIESSSKTYKKESDSDDESEYLLVYNRPKQYFGSLYEPDKQYACTLCTYTTNHRPSMEDHVYVHTNEKPYKCGYCGEEIYTRYAATYHIKYKHTGMARNFIQNKADITKYYINRAKRDDEKNQFKLVDTRRVKIPSRNGKSVQNQQNKIDIPTEHSMQRERSTSPPHPPPPPPAPAPSVKLAQPANLQLSTISSNNPRETASTDYRFLLAWSYYLASQAAWLSPTLQQQGQSSFSLPTDPESAAKFLQTIETAMNPLAAKQTLNNNHEQTRNQHDFGTKNTSAVVKDELNES